MGGRAACEQIVRDVTARPLAAVAFETAVADHLRGSHAAWAAWLGSGSREDMTGLAARVAVPTPVVPTLVVPTLVVPTLVVAGSGDEALGADVQARETSARILGACLVTVRPPATSSRSMRPRRSQAWPERTCLATWRAGPQRLFAVPSCRRPAGRTSLAARPRPGAGATWRGG